MFEIINDCVRNYHSAVKHAPPIDWSGLGGVPWLIGAVTGTVLLFVGLYIAGRAAARQEARFALYDEAEAEGQLRAARRETFGYVEYFRK